MINLKKYQLKALGKIRSGCVLCGDTGSGKSLTAVAWYYLQNGGSPGFLTGGEYARMKEPKDLYIITTARKRDTYEWEKELALFLLTPSDKSVYRNKVVIDSWNNVHKYTKIKNAFFIFDEQRVVGKGLWVDSFLKIVKSNLWLLLSATPGDNWGDYVPLFLANGFYRNRTEFSREHEIYARFVTYPKVEKYVGVKKLEFLRDQILVDMDFKRPTTAHVKDISVSFDGAAYKQIYKTRFDPWEQKPIENASGLCYCLRKVVNSDKSRGEALIKLAAKHPKIIVFYNFDYELDILRSLAYGPKTAVAEWNGHRHEPIPVESERWIYLVQYAAGAEGWNCIETDTMVFYSQHYSYKATKQAMGRIDRMNTPFVDLYYYFLKSAAAIDIAIGRALKNKKEFNERRFVHAQPVRKRTDPYAEEYRQKPRQDRNNSGADRNKLG